ncbi:hypothetical protein [Allostreptomyces psammosilenae]|uniref:Uncharacterized protein n=1 Tax=Allostreptomyces psammosilenae TaxID=1892865 RepID=A0A852ZYV5_9ACTN|nr:hypothetical protein [Allostreptomyces psammosilenae]NYI07235.1 hypothetical protein [Allostreptomyces psammosilenae]
MNEKIACFHCGQDWIRRYRRVHTAQVFYMCPECESVWVEGQPLDRETEFALDDFLGSPDSPTSWGMIVALE